MSAPPAPRCRFAPSPTGFLHVGSAQSALFNWLFARHTGGEFLLRIEDTDVERNRPELTDNILEMLRWLGLEWDGEPVRQSERRESHAAAAERLGASGHTYWCDCTREAIAARTSKPGYDGFCRDRGLGPGPGRALRFRTPDTGTTSWPDVVRGEVAFDNEHLEDFVVVRSTGAPLFLVANTVDDAEMGITHVIRGEDHVNNTPKYLLLWDALGYGEHPTFAHLPLLVSESRRKLSKRRDSVSVADYRDAGYLPEAMRNYLALIGWAPPGGEEIVPIERMIEQFALEDVGHTSAFFDVRKLQFVNAEYIRALPVERFTELAAGFLPPGDGPARALAALAPLVQERVRTLAETPGMLEFLYLDEPRLDEDAWARVVRDERAPAMLDGARARLAEVPHWDPPAIEAAVKDAGLEAGYVRDDGNVQVAKAQLPVRVAVTGQRVGLPLWESIAQLGRERTLERLGAARARLSRRSAAAAGTARRRGGG